jgi:hypothetical protein
MPATVIYTDHAIDRLESRGITKAEVEEALRNPDSRMPGAQEHTERVHKRMPNGRSLQVIYKPKGARVVIITACWREK